LVLAYHQPLLPPQQLHQQQQQQQLGTMVLGEGGLVLLKMLEQAPKWTLFQEGIKG
jgi:hypothetical protein